MTLEEFKRLYLQEYPNRRLLHHSNSSCLFEVESEEQARSHLESGEVDDVTGVDEYERRHRKQQADETKRRGG